jgi:hypothetical protein
LLTAATSFVNRGLAAGVSAADLRRHLLPLVRAAADEISGLLRHR